jgi:hypothetical protein
MEIIFQGGNGKLLLQHGWSDPTPHTLSKIQLIGKIDMNDWNFGRGWFYAMHLSTELPAQNGLSNSSNPMYSFILSSIALFASKWLENYPYRITLNWWFFGSSAILVVCIALFTVSFQAIKAAIANPVKSLRTE